MTTPARRFTIRVSVLDEAEREWCGCNLRMPWTEAFQEPGVKGLTLSDAASATHHAIVQQIQSCIPEAVEYLMPRVLSGQRCAPERRDVVVIPPGVKEIHLMDTRYVPMLRGDNWGHPESFAIMPVAIFAEEHEFDPIESRVDGIPTTHLRLVSYIRSDLLDKRVMDAVRAAHLPAIQDASPLRRASTEIEYAAGEAP